MMLIPALVEGTVDSGGCVRSVIDTLASLGFVNSGGGRHDWEGWVFWLEVCIP